MRRLAKAFSKHTGKGRGTEQAIDDRNPIGLDLDDSHLFAKLNQDLEESKNLRDILLDELYLTETGPADNLGPKTLRSTYQESTYSIPTELKTWEPIDDPPPRPLADPLEEWPARLLHVPSMTSLERKPGNWYGIHQSPRYATLSYTWGRWTVPINQASSYPALGVGGTSWRIPSISPTLFTVEEFQQVIETITGEARCDFVWIDIACIDQNENSPQGALEIGRQIKIFRSAYQTFIWLATDVAKPEFSSTQGILQQLLDGTEKARPVYYSLMDEHVLSASGVEAVPLQMDETGHPAIYRLLEEVSACISSLTDLPWFTSLWTLQEAFLKPAAMLIDAKGQLMKSTRGDPIVLDDILRCCETLYQLCTLIGAKPRAEDTPREIFMIEGVLKRVIERRGLHALAQRNAMALYTCAKSRQTLRQLDRIYGIMQIWDFQLGISAPGADLSRVWTLGELEIELGKHLLQEFPLESQLHVHTASVTNRQAWRISSSSIIPPTSLMYSQSGHLTGEVDRHSSQLSCRRADDVTYGHFQGKICSIDALRSAWEILDRHEQYRASLKAQNKQSIVQIALDRTEVLNNTALQLRFPLHDVPAGEHHKLAALISEFCGNLGRRLSVLLLGTTKQLKTVNFSIAIGVIVMDVPDSVIGRWWKRVGICLWTSMPMDESKGLADVEEALRVTTGTSDVWCRDEGLFG